MCKNWVRGCFAEVTTNAACRLCLDDENQRDKIRRGDIIKSNDVRTDDRKCMTCALVFPLSNFVNDKQSLNLNCSNCRQKARVIDARRKATPEHKIKARTYEQQTYVKHRRIESRRKHPEWAQNYRVRSRSKDELEYLRVQAQRMREYRLNHPDKFEAERMRYNHIPAYRYDTYKRCAVTRCIKFDLTKDQAIEYFLADCYYCGTAKTMEQLNGIDRFFNDDGYNENNCVSCCKTCNNMKYMHSPHDFIYIVRHILNNLNIANTGEKYPEVFRNTKITSYTEYLHKSKDRCIPFELSKDQYYNIKILPCYVCGKVTDDKHTNGIDRINNDIGYTLDNCRSCCITCNLMKKDMSFDDFIDQLKNINNNNLLFDDCIKLLIINPQIGVKNYDDEIIELDDLNMYEIDQFDDILI